MSESKRYKFDPGDWARAIQELDAAFAGAWAPRIKSMVKATRTFAYFGGPVLEVDGTLTWHLNGTIVCPDSATSYVQRNPLTGTVSVAATCPWPQIPMAVVVCSGGLLVRFEDARDSVLGRRMVPLGGTSGQLIKKLSGTEEDYDWASLNLDDLGDVDIYEPADGEALTYDGGSGLWVNMPGGGGGSADVEDEGTPIVTDAATINFVGAGVTVTDVGGVATVTVPGDSNPGSEGFPASPPGTPSAYDEEGVEGSLNAKWTEVATPDASYVRDTDRDGTYLGMSGPGHATRVWHLRQAIANADGDYPVALIVTAKISVTTHDTTAAIVMALSDNAAISTGNYFNFGLSCAVAFGADWFTNHSGSSISVTLPGGIRTLYIHYQRNTAATNNVKAFISYDGRSWVRLRTVTETANADYLHLYLSGGAATSASALWVDWVRVNDARFLQPE